MTLREKVFEIVEVRQTKASKLFDAFILGLIILNVVVIVLETENTFRLANETLFHHIEAFSVFVFTIEYVLRLWTAPEFSHLKKHSLPRLRFMVTPMAVVDFLAIAPYYLVGFLSVDPLYLRVIRLIRLFKLTRYSRSMDLLLTVLRKESYSLISAISIIIMLILLAAAGMYLVEGGEQPDAFGSIPRAIWWAAVTLTTVGYGDVVPSTLAGRGFAIFISMLGIGLAALPAGIIASGFNRETEARKLKFETKVKGALADGIVTRSEKRQLNKERIRLGLDKEEAREIMSILQSTLEVDDIGDIHCPNCGHTILHTHQKETVK